MNSGKGEKIRETGDPFAIIKLIIINGQPLHLILNIGYEDRGLAKPSS